MQWEMSRSEFGDGAGDNPVGHITEFLFYLTDLGSQWSSSKQVTRCVWASASWLLCPRGAGEEGKQGPGQQ